MLNALVVGEQFATHNVYVTFDPDDCTVTSGTFWIATHGFATSTFALAP
jgi:hypothetical protein